MQKKYIQDNDRARFYYVAECSYIWEATRAEYINSKGEKFYEQYFSMIHGQYKKLVEKFTQVPCAENYLALPFQLGLILFWTVPKVNEISGAYNTPERADEHADVKRVCVRYEILLAETELLISNT